MFLAMVKYGWGMGDSPEAALRKAASVTGMLLSDARKKYLMWKYDPVNTPEAYIDDVGSLCWKGERPREVERVGVEKKR